MKHNDKNILHVVNIYFVLPYFIGGQFAYFRQKGYRMFAVCSESEYLDGYAREQGFGYKVVPVKRSFSVKQDLKSIRQICSYIRENEIGVIVGHTPKGGLLAMLAGWLMRVPRRIYFRHGLVYETSHGLKRFVLMTVDRISSACATKIVCVSPSVLQRSIEDHLAPADKQLVLGNGTCSGIDTQGKFCPEKIDGDHLAAMRRRWGIADGDWVIGYTGRLVKDKGIIELVSAFRKLKKRYRNMKLLLVGMFEVRDALPEDIQDDIKNDPQIVWTDFQNTDQEYFYAMMNVYVLASYREGFPTGVLEAQSMGVPVVTTRVTGCRDAIVEGRTGLFAEHSADSIAEAITEIHDKKVVSGTAARKWVVEKFDNLIVWNEIEKLYI